MVILTLDDNKRDIMNYNSFPILWIHVGIFSMGEKTLK